MQYTSSSMMTTSGVAAASSVFAGGPGSVEPESRERLEAWEREKRVRREARRRRAKLQRATEQTESASHAARQQVLEARRERKQEYVGYLRDQLTKKKSPPLTGGQQHKVVVEAGSVASAGFIKGGAPRMALQPARSTFGGCGGVTTWIGEAGPVAAWGGARGDATVEDAAMRRKRDAERKATEARRAAQAALAAKRARQADRAQDDDLRRRDLDQNRKRWTPDSFLLDPNKNKNGGASGLGATQNPPPGDGPRVVREVPDDDDDDHHHHHHHHHDHRRLHRERDEAEEVSTASSTMTPLQAEDPHGEFLFGGPTDQVSSSSPSSVERPRSEWRRAPQNRWDEPATTKGTATTTTTAASERRWSEVADDAARVLADRIHRGRAQVEHARAQVEAHQGLDDAPPSNSPLPSPKRGGGGNSSSNNDNNNDVVVVGDLAWAKTLSHAPGALFESLDLEMSLVQREAVAPHQRANKPPGQHAPLTTGAKKDHAAQYYPAASAPPAAAKTGAAAENSYARRAALAVERARNAASATQVTSSSAQKKKKGKKKTTTKKAPSDDDGSTADSNMLRWGRAAPLSEQEAQKEALRRRAREYADAQRARQAADRLAHNPPQSEASTRARNNKQAAAHCHDDPVAMLPCERRPQPGPAPRRGHDGAGNHHDDHQHHHHHPTTTTSATMMIPSQRRRPGAPPAANPSQVAQPVRHEPRRPPAPPRPVDDDPNPFGRTSMTATSFDENALMRSLQRLDHELGTRRRRAALV